MKKIFTFFIIAFAIASNCYTQSSFELYLSNENGDNIRQIVQGEEIIYNILTDEEQKVYFLVKNISANEVATKVVKTFNAVEGSTNSICSASTVADALPVCAPGDTTKIFRLASNEISGTVKFDFYQGINAGTSTFNLNVISNKGSADSASFKVKIIGSNPNSVNNINSNFSVYPNPASNYFTIGYNFTPDSYVEVYNVLGKVVAKIKPGEGTNFVVDCSKWEKGYYFCRLYKSDKVEKTLKLIVTR